MPSRQRSYAYSNYRTDYSKLKKTAPFHIHRKTIVEYVGTYKAGKKGKGKQTLTIRTVNKPPPPLKELQLAGDTLKTFRRIKLTKHTRKAIIIMATKTKEKASKSGSKKRAKPVDEETEIDDELENIEELAEDETDEDEDSDDNDSDDEDSDDDDSDEDDDDEEVEKPKSKKKGKKGKKQSRAKANGKVGSQEVAAAAGCDARTLRMVLRKHNIAKDEESNRYEWDSLEDPTVKKILKLIAEGAAKEVKKEGLDKLKKKKEEEGDSKKSKKDKKKKKKKEEDEDDE